MEWAVTPIDWADVMFTSKTIIVGGELEVVGIELRRVEAVCWRWVREGPRRAMEVGWFVDVYWEIRWVATWVLRGEWEDTPVITMVLGGGAVMVVRWLMSFGLVRESLCN